METIFYFMTVGIIYGVLYSFYFLFFRKNTNFQANRIYLLAIVPIAFILPFINSTVEVNTQYQVTLPVFEIGSIANVTHQTTGFNWSDVFIYFYITISITLLIRFIAIVSKTIYTIITIKNSGNNIIQPFSFFSFIHVPTNIETEDRLAIIKHEEVHSKQFHSLDVIVYELSKIMLWWNPLIWMGLYSVKSNHEFIADKLASAKADKYLSVLVAQLLGVNCSSLVNNFKSKPLLKKRIMMMKTKKSNKLSLIKYVLVIPIIGLTFLATAQDQEPPVPPTPPVPLLKNDTTVHKIMPHKQKIDPDVYAQFKGGLGEYLSSHVVYPAEAKKNKIEGKVFVSFIIDSNGNVKDPKLLRPKNKLLDAEAIRVIKNMPKWIPAQKDGKNISCVQNLPFVFKLNQK